jgi:hypothetical protein
MDDLVKVKLGQGISSRTKDLLLDQHQLVRPAAIGAK